MALSASAGNGLIPETDEIAGRMAFSQRWMSANKLNSDLCALVPIIGDSMVPTISDGSFVLIHAAEKVPDRPGIFAFSIDDEVFVKRLAPLWNETKSKRIGLLISSDNPAYAPRTLTGSETARVNVAGRVRLILTAVD